MRPEGHCKDLHFPSSSVLTWLCSANDIISHSLVDLDIVRWRLHSQLYVHRMYPAGCIYVGISSQSPITNNFVEISKGIQVMPFCVLIFDAAAK